MLLPWVPGRPLGASAPTLCAHGPALGSPGDCASLVVVYYQDSSLGFVLWSLSQRSPIHEVIHVGGNIVRELGAEGDISEPIKTPGWLPDSTNIQRGKATCQMSHSQSPAKSKVESTACGPCFLGHPNTLTVPLKGPKRGKGEGWA